MPHDDDLMEELRSISEAKGDQDYDIDEAQRGLEERFLGDDLENAGAPSVYRPAVQRSQPCNQASMVCLRGPCRYLWQMTVRFGLEASDNVGIQRHRVCIRHNYETQLADQNVYACDEWWPRQLAWVPESIWATIRLPARDLYERWLKRQGYNFDWRWFGLDSFEWDSKGKRQFSGPGGAALFDEAQAKQKTTTGYGADAPKEG